MVHPLTMACHFFLDFPITDGPYWAGETPESPMKPKAPPCDPMASASELLSPHRRTATLLRMVIKARVRGGRLVVDEPTDLPEGTEVELVAIDLGEDSGEWDLSALQAALRDVQAAGKAGRRPGEADVIKALRSRLRSDRLDRESAKLDPAEEASEADQGLRDDLKEWPEY